MARLIVAHDRQIARAAVLCAVLLPLLLAACSTSFVSPLLGQSFPAADGTVPGQPVAGQPVAGQPGTVPPPTGTVAAAANDPAFAITPNLGPVRFSPDDVLRFSVFGHPEMQYDATVEPDGTIQLPVIGRLPAAGRTPDEIRDDARRTLLGRLRTDKVLLQPADVIRMTVWQQPELTHVAMVQLDGMLTLPLVGEVRAANRTIDAVRREVDAKLRSLLDNPQVSILPERLGMTVLADADISILPEKLAPRLVAILGEVQQPGVFPIHGRMRVMNLLAQSHNLDTAELNDVIVVRGRTEGKPRYRSLRIADFAAGKAPNDNIDLAPDDIVIVPKSTIAAVGVFIDQFFGKTAQIFNWWISLQDARVAADLAGQVRLLNAALRNNQQP